MSTKTRNLSNISGANVTAPDNTLFAANALESYANDAAFAAAITPQAGSIYWNTTELCVREYNGTAWQYDKTIFDLETDSTTTGSNQDVTPNTVAQVIRFTQGSLASIRSIAPTNQKFLQIINGQGSTSIVLVNESGGATAANRIVTGSGGDYTILAGQMVQLTYDTGASRWRMSGIGATASLLNPMSAVGDIIYGGASGVATALAGNTTINKKFLGQTGNGSASAAPVWEEVDQVLGVVSGSAIAAGYVGEIGASSGSAANIGVTTSFTNATSITVDAGIWDLRLWGYFRSVASITGCIMGISTDSGASTFSDIAGFASPGAANTVSSAMNTSVDCALQLTRRVNISITTVYYIKCRSTGTATDGGFRIDAFRVA